MISNRVGVKILVIDIENEPKEPVLSDAIASKKEVLEGIDQIGTNQSKREVDRSKLCNAVFNVGDGVPCSTSIHL